MSTGHGKIIDFHTHAFPDEIAINVMAQLAKQTTLEPFLDGKLSSLLNSMDGCGIGRSVICCIATRASQFESIFKWCKSIRSERIEPFPSVHPDDADFATRLQQIKDAGFKGVKLHPYYQDFFIDEEKLFPIYEKINELGLIVVMHCGFDFCYDRIDRAGAGRVRKVVDRFEGIKFVAAHLGGWEQWEQVRESLLGKNVYMELSFSLDYMSEDEIKKMIASHPKEYILFGSDSPWDEQSKVVRQFCELKLGEELEELILYKNAAGLLGLSV